MGKKVVIIGAGISGLLACKYAMQKGFDPLVFEADEAIGGVWTHTIESTKLQSSKQSFQFSDFPWPSSIPETHPDHTQVLEYLQSYAHHFGLFPFIKFNSRVVSIEYVGESNEEMEVWDSWGGTGRPFESRGKWDITVQDTLHFSTEVYQAEFVILCIGRFSGVPNIPEFPPNEGPEVFTGKVMHSMDYSAMDNEASVKLIKGKRVAIIGSQKSAVDIAAECADANGVEKPCTIIRRRAHWLLPGLKFWGVSIGSLYFTRFSELLLHKPEETIFYCFIATLLSPLRWGITKFAESYIRWKVPLRKYDMIPKHSFLKDVSSCHIGMLPENFYDKVDKGSIILRKSQRFSFCQHGLLIDGEDEPIQTDIVILGTGFKGDLKLKSIFKSPIFQNHIYGSSTPIVPLYRQVIHPRIPQLAIMGYAETLSNLWTSEMRCQWLFHYLNGKFELPSIREMEKEVKAWENSMRIYAGDYVWRTCISNINIWYNDQLCKDMGLKHKRKKGIFAEFFQPYGPADYAGLTSSE